MSTPETPYTREEMYLSAIADGDSSGIPDRPYTRIEKYLDAIATGDSSGIPETPYTREEMYLDEIARNGGGGGGGDITVESKSINANGTYTAPTGKAYSPVTVSVPASAVDSGTKSITSNGNNQDVVGYAAVDVAVPNSYAAGDEGKVVSNGQLVAQTAHAEVNQNGTIDTTLNDSVVVNVSGGGGGLEYETGTYTPTEDTASATIPFSNTHNAMPAVVIMAEASDSLSSFTNYSLFEWNYINTGDLFGGGYPRSASYFGYGRVDVIRKSNTSSLSFNNTASLEHPSSDTSDTDATRPRYWVTASSFKVYAANASYYWRSGRTYKWIAIWAPST